MLPVFPVLPPLLRQQQGEEGAASPPRWAVPPGGLRLGAFGVCKQGDVGHVHVDVLPHALGRPPWLCHPRDPRGRTEAHVAAPRPPQITKVMLLKGWRCVECIVCEVCGKASDPSRLLLCDDCDISYHTYCLDPPLQTVPKGGWKCKWCVGWGGAFSGGW